MTDLIGTVLASLLGDSRFWYLAAAAALAGLVRGFSGFGAAMIYVPIAAALFEPRIATVTLFIFDVLATLHMLLAAFRHCTWREVLPITIGAAVTFPIGVKFLVSVDPVLLRWIISVLIIVVVSAMTAGWRYRRAPGYATSAGVGALAGVGGGLAGLLGPPVILFWLGGQSGAATVRWNIFAFFGLISVVGAATFWASGLFTREVVTTGLVLTPLYAAAIVAGSWLFGKATDRQFRVLALSLCAAIALATLPLWQNL